MSITTSSDVKKYPEGLPLLSLLPGMCKAALGLFPNAGNVADVMTSPEDGITAQDLMEKIIIIISVSHFGAT